MKAGRSLQDLVVELDRQAKTKKDFLADTRKLEARPIDGGIEIHGINGGLEVGNTGHNQMATTLGIPRPYWDRMRGSAPDLLAANVNHWFRSEPKKRLVRTLDGRIRAFLSDSYRPLDNLDLAEAVLPKLADVGASVVSGEVTEDRFFLKAVTDRVSGEVGRGDVVQAGIVVSNSEIGSGALRLEELVYRLVCLNGAITAQAVRKAHLGRSSGQDAIEDSREYFRDRTRQADDRAFWLKVQDAAGAMFEPARFTKRLEVLRGASVDKIEAEPEAVVEVVTKRFGLAESEQRSVLKHLLMGNDLTKWGLTNAITRASQDVDDYGRATEMEQFGGQVVELPRSDWKAIASVN